MVLIIGPCRTGTTALGNVFARTGHNSYMQPIKSMRRALVEGETVSWGVKTDCFASSKETLGPDHEAEFFDPIETLLEIGYPGEKLRVIVILREPEATLTSWVRMWGSASVEKFIEAYQLTAEIKQRSESLGVAVIPYVHEAIRQDRSALVVERLIQRVGVGDVCFSPYLIDWSEGPAFGERGSNIVFFDDPPPRFIQGVREWGGYRFRQLVPDLTLAETAAIQESGIDEIYRQFKVECEENLGITI